ncbi:hypothetical protein Aab01nite_35130 [Paractinoplanes abujensis]|uniref:Uncharacterized protein n=1 Tax=Paractinoplanes abujensis TaxID=882441 RepID=A0A7W7CZP3_9ACTN|nr:hypothetical protein [Actinoplanes abujensis]MBB4697587.1 hypothetical protein [Actinoplanes abujensis]GID19923.1 hypothetical protein Aab01nite_35130 [Actinoplanes abujensis]
MVNRVDALTVAGFGALPLLIGLGLVALLSRLGGWGTRTAVIVAPVPAPAPIVVMTLPADFDGVSTLTPAVCHVVLAVVSVVAVLALGRKASVPVELSAAQNGV